MTTSKNSFAIALTALEVNRIDSVAIMAIKKCQAADELLEALQRALEFIDAQTGVQRFTLQDQARAAIAKATS